MSIFSVSLRDYKIYSRLEIEDKTRKVTYSGVDDEEKYLQ